MVRGDRIRFVSFSDDEVVIECNVKKVKLQKSWALGRLGE